MDNNLKKKNSELNFDKNIILQLRNPTKFQKPVS